MTYIEVNLYDVHNIAGKFSLTAGAIKIAVFGSQGQFPSKLDTVIPKIKNTCDTEENGTAT